MNKVLIFLVLISFIICQSSEAKREEMRQKRKREREHKLMECILSNKQTSPTLKKLIEENKEEENLMKALHPIYHKLEISDRVIIRNCRKELYDKRREIREQRRKKQEQEQREPQNNNI